MNPKHIKQIYNIERASFKRPYSLSHLEFLARVCPETFLLALIDNCPVGYVVAFMAEGEARIISIAIDLRWRRRGIGESLMLEIMDRAEKLGAKKIYLEVKESNNPALRLYEKLGFKKVDKIKDYYGERESALVLFKKL